jgi:hypothetical protein
MRRNDAPKAFLRYPPGAFQPDRVANDALAGTSMNPSGAAPIHRAGASACLWAGDARD